MALLGYKSRFVDPLLAGTKLGTIRSLRKYPVEPGDRLYHYTGLRTKHSFKIGESDCLSVEPITILINIGLITVGKLPTVLPKIYKGAELDSFAIRDGFSNWDDMREFWIENHGVKKGGRKVILVPFDGIWIQHTPVSQLSRPR